MSTTPKSIAQTMQTYAALWLPRASLPEGASVHDLKNARMALHEAQKSLSLIKTSCSHCKHYDIDSCTMHGNVPEDFKKSEDQCGDWIYDGIAF
jgi:hypothetical protein